VTPSPLRGGPGEGCCRRHRCHSGRRVSGGPEPGAI
jgi:hypothetical protein